MPGMYWAVGYSTTCITSVLAIVHRFGQSLLELNAIFPVMKLALAFALAVALSAWGPATALTPQTVIYTEYGPIRGVYEPEYQVVVSPLLLIRSFRSSSSSRAEGALWATVWLAGLND
jgi:hypothetical protein